MQFVLIKKETIKENNELISNKILKKDFKFSKINKSISYYIIGAFILSFILYFNSIFNDYALDDVVTITQNKYTLQGFSGIMDLLFKDSFAGYTNLQLLSGGRYRPLSLITFAIEISVFGKNNPHISHLINILFFAISMSILFIVCYRYLFNGNIVAASISTLLFIVHPIHTEVISNIKSRDEILSLLFLLLATAGFFEYLKTKQNKYWLIISIISFSFALLSKENAIMFVILIPLILMFFYNYNLFKSVKSIFPILLILLLYLITRFLILGINNVTQNDILNAPYLYATPIQAFATKIYILGKYLLLMIIPFPLCYDYTWNSITYVNIESGKFILSFIFILALIALAIKGFKQRKKYSFFIILFLFMISLVSNFIFNIGALMGERFMFQAGLPMVLAVGFYSEKLFFSINKLHRKLIISILSVVSLMFIYLSFDRNKDWKNFNTLCLADKDKYPSAHLKLNAGATYLQMSLVEKNQKIKDSLIDLSLKYYYNAIKINQKYFFAYADLASIYYRQNKIDSTIINLEKALSINYKDERLNDFLLTATDKAYLVGKEYKGKNDLEKTAIYFKMAMKYNSKYINLLPFYYESAKEAFYSKKNTEQAIGFLNIYLEFKKDDVNVLNLYAQLCESLKDYNAANIYYQQALALEPNNLEVINGLKKLRNYN